MDKPAITLITCGRFERYITDSIIDDIKREFGYPVVIIEWNQELSNFYNPSRRQYDANQILHFVSEHSSVNAFKTLGLVNVDLFIPILTYIFGQAQLNGRVGIVSGYRLKNELYGLEKNNALLVDRFSKVVIHELGHMFGLIHCQNPICIMRSSTYVEDLDQKEKQFCINCQSELKKNIDQG